MGTQWDWEYAGSVEIKNKSNSVTLKDLTGFEGRCDAILFTKDKNVVIPNRKEDLSAFRKQLLNIPAKPEDGGIMISS